MIFFNLVQILATSKLKVQITQQKVTDSAHAPKVMDGETVGLGTIFVVYQTIRNARLPGGRLQEFYSISKFEHCQTCTPTEQADNKPEGGWLIRKWLI